MREFVPGPVVSDSFFHGLSARGALAPRKGPRRQAQRTHQPELGAVADWAANNELRGVPAARARCGWRTRRVRPDICGGFGIRRSARPYGLQQDAREEASWRSGILAAKEAIEYFAAAGFVQTEGRIAQGPWSISQNKLDERSAVLGELREQTRVVDGAMWGSGSVLGGIRDEFVEAGLFVDDLGDEAQWLHGGGKTFSELASSRGSPGVNGRLRRGHLEVRRADPSAHQSTSQTRRAVRRIPKSSSPGHWTALPRVWSSRYNRIRFRWKGLLL